MARHDPHPEVSVEKTDCEKCFRGFDERIHKIENQNRWWHLVSVCLPVAISVTVLLYCHFDGKSWQERMDAIQQSRQTVKAMDDRDRKIAEQVSSLAASINILGQNQRMVLERLSQTPAVHAPLPDPLHYRLIDRSK